MAYQERSHVYVVFLIILCEHFILLEWSSFLSMATPHNVCAVHLRMFCRLGDIIEYTRGVQYNGGCTEYIGGYRDECGGYHEYTGKGDVSYTGGIPRGFHTNSVVFPMIFPRIYHDILRST